MARYRFLTAALVLGWLAVLGTADDKRPGSRDDSREGKGASAWMGRIARVDSDKHTITLEDVTRQGSGDRTEKSTTGSDKATSGTSRTDASDKGKSDRTKTFTLNEKTKISLDGKEATFRDLRSGLYARVHADRSGSKSGTSDKGTSGGTAGSDAARKDRDTTSGSGSAGHSMMVSKVEAFTKAPSRTGTGTGDRSGGTSRDK